MDHTEDDRRVSNRARFDGENRLCLDRCLLGNIHPDLEDHARSLRDIENLERAGLVPDVLRRGTRGCNYSEIGEDIAIDTNDQTIGTIAGIHHLPIGGQTPIDNLSIRAYQLP